MVAESTRPGECHVGLLRDDQNGIDGSYDIPGWSQALDRLREKADTWRNAHR